MPTLPDHPQRRSEHGQALTEIALVLPILAILVLSIVQYGVMIWHESEITAAAREGARRAVVARVEPQPVQSVKDTALASLDAVDQEDVEVQVDGGWDRDDTVTVTVTTPYELDIAGIEVWQGMLQGQATVRIG